MNQLATRSTELLTYLPRKNTPGSDKAACSMHGVIGRFLKTLGILGEDLTASCAYTAGLRRVLERGSVAEALLAAGYTRGEEATLLKLLGLTRQSAAAPTAAPIQHRNGF
ncbi:hypothetical protein J4G33_15360 [Actinotalea sp. BY-33]|uniref:Uncharacterized protein n=1 Tax=Actinotalea soli TaxID=2819234 RepID=A0A939LW08_9CELL|nr:hypothetical protein [Actinotalea soli]MBO1753184.1 hypothetical protein [Actinotalea soli]